MKSLNLMILLLLPFSFGCKPLGESGSQVQSGYFGEECKSYYKNVKYQKSLLLGKKLKFIELIGESKTESSESKTADTNNLRILRLSATPPYKKKGQHFAGIWYFKIAKN